MFISRWRRLSGWLIITLALLGAGLLMVTWPSAAQDDDNAPGIEVGLVIQGPDGEPETYCVSLDGENPTGQDALRATGRDLIVEESSRGVTVCKVDDVGCDFPSDACFCQCMGGPDCAYWTYFHRTDAGTWLYSAMGAQAPVTDGSVEMWWWRDSSKTDAAPPSVLSFEEICSPSSSPDFPRTVIDGMEREVTIPAPPQRIASVTLGSDEILLDMLGPDRLLGVTHFATDPAISNISDQLDQIDHTDLIGNPEYLISLDADLVILAAYNNPAAIDQLLDADVPVFVLNEFNTLDDIRANIRLLGQVTGEDEKAAQMIEDMDAQIAAIHEAVQDEAPVRVLYYEPGGITYGPGSTVDEIITLAGGINVIDDPALGPYPLVNAEFVLAADPDVILLGGWFAGEDDPLAAFLADDVFSTLRAVKEGRVIPIVDAHMTNVSQYVVLGIEDVARALYPEALE